MGKMSNILTDKRWYKKNTTVPDDIVFTADEFLSFKQNIQSVIVCYGRISVGELIDLVNTYCGCGLQPEYISYKYYWSYPRDFGCERIEKGKPKPTDTWRLVANNPIYE